MAVVHELGENIRYLRDNIWSLVSADLPVPGELVYSRLLNQEVIVINSEELAKDLLERRSSNYSDRPQIIRMTNDLYVAIFICLSEMGL